jgi:hypothetical protein
MVDYGDFQSQLSGFSRIFEDFDWAVIFTQDVRRKTFGILLCKYFFVVRSIVRLWFWVRVARIIRFKKVVFETFYG